MSIAQSILPEFDMEIAATRGVLEAVPDGKLDWQPHEKSMSLRRLASHVAEVPGWTGATLAQDEFDIAPPGEEPYSPPELGSAKEMVASLDKSAAEARGIIENMADENFMKPWTLKSGGNEIFTAPRIGVFRRQIMNHLIHHRGQLTVYLRMCGAKVPQTLGPTADFPEFG